jgi:predicted Zn-dependent protease with MMP-like domain
VDEETFEQIVEEALETLPPEFRRRLQNVQVVIAARPTRQQLRAAGVRRGGTLFGLYEGVPMTARSMTPPLFPDMITIFREPLVRYFRDPDELRAEIRHTVIHEIAHFFGISDDRLRELGAY